MRFQSVAVWLLVCSVLRAGGAATETSPETLMANGHWKSARAIVEPAFNANPHDPHLLYLMSRIKWSFGDRKAALTMADEALAIDSGKPAYHVHTAFMYGQLLNEASTLGKVGLMRRFKREVEAALALDSNNIDALLLRAVFLAAAPRLAGGDMKQAEQIAQKLPKLDSEKGNIALGRFAYNLKDWGRAERAYHAALAVNPQSYAATYALANLYCCIMDTPRWEAAEQRAREAIRLNSSRAGAFAILAAALANGQRWAELDALIATAERNFPEDLSPEYAAAKLLRSTGKDTPRADRYLRNCLAQEPEGDTAMVAESRRFGSAKADLNASR